MKIRDSNGRFIKGHPNTHKKDSALKISKGLKGKYIEEKHCGWKGDDAKYQAKHIWIRKKLGKANKCDRCNGKSGSMRFEWANLSGEYKREITDWEQMCRACHHKYDNISQKIWRNRLHFLSSF